MSEMGEHRRRKMMTFFKRIDKDGNGVFTENDLQLIAENIIKAANFTGARAEGLRQKYSEMWNKYYEPVANNGVVRFEDMIENLKNHNTDDMKPITAEQMNLLFDTIDTNQDGFIQIGEYITFFGITGVGEEFAKSAFDALDTNHDGLVSRDEFVSVGLDFYFLEEPSHPADLFHGPLE